MKKTLPIGDQELKVADLRPVYGRIIDLRNDTVPEREPDPAGGRVRRPYPVFAPMGPPGLNAGRPKASRWPRKLSMFDNSFSYGFKGKYTTFYAVCREAKPCEPFFSRYLPFRSD